jgi:hypothetical protein
MKLERKLTSHEKGCDELISKSRHPDPNDRADTVTLADFLHANSKREKPRNRNGKSNIGEP